MLLFRDVKNDRTAGPRTPSWLEGLPGLQRASHVDGDILTLADPWLIPDAKICVWHDTEDGWQVASFGKDPLINQYLRPRSDLPVAEVKDGIGRLWFAPIVFDQHGSTVLPLPWGRNADGVRCRKPNPEQQKLIAIAEAVRIELAAGRIDSVSVDTLASWVYPMIEATYFLSGSVLDALGLVDDMLGILVCLSASGFPKEMMAGAADG